MRADTQSGTGRKRSLSLVELLIIVICLAILVVIGVWAAVWLDKLWVAADAVQADVAQLESMAGGELAQIDVERAVDLVRTTRADLDRLATLGQPLLELAPHLGWLPGYGPDIRAAPALLEMGIGLITAGEETLDCLLPLWRAHQAMQTDGSQGTVAQQELRAEALNALRSGRTRFEAALVRIKEARVVRAQITTDGLHPRLRNWMVRFDRYLPWAEVGIKGILMLPEMLGAEGPRTFLLLVQNEDELRATGGFISGVVRVAIREGEIKELLFEDSYAVDDLSQTYPDPPEPLREYMRSDLWLFRDSNWSPDFPTSARQAMDLYAIGRRGQTDGVIAMDQQAIRLLVEALGPLHVEGYDQAITGQNVIELARQAWKPGAQPTGEWWTHRKDFMAAVLGAATRRLQSNLSLRDLSRIATAVLRSLEQKHLLAYLADAESVGLLAELGWDGAQYAGSGDYVMVVDSNVGFNKVNALVEQSIEYMVDLSDPSHPRAVLTVIHRHPIDTSSVDCRHQPHYDETYEQMMEGCYWDYLRVYIPLETELTSATPHAVPGQELLSGRPSRAEVTVGPSERGRNVFATLLLLRPASVLETRFEYTLPGSTVRSQGGKSEYVLTCQKQPGTRAVPLRVRLLLPPGATVQTTEPDLSQMSGSVLEYASTLEVDRTLRVTWVARP